jgi:4-amino-4-deoxy-L-arabinose transferase-like glycosyltransferase
MQDGHQGHSSRARDGRGLWFLGLLSLLFFVVWSFVVPVFEGPDEFLHWQYARYLHDEWRLPVYGPYTAEANSPPLYYAAIAPVAYRTPTPPPLIWADGHGGLAHPFGVRLHLTASDDFLHYWPIRTARLISALMAVATVILCGLAAREITGRDSTALLAAGFAAFLPQFTFRGMNVSNDVLVAAMSAWFLYLIVRLVTRGFTWRIGVLAAVALAGAFLSKISAICLAPVLVLVIVSEPVPWRRRVGHLAVLGVALLIVLPWAYRNVVLYGDPMAIGAMSHAVPSMIVERSVFDVALYTTLPRELFKSFVGVFGYGNLPLGKRVYAVYLACMAFAVIGLIKGLITGLRQKDAAADRSASYGRVLLILTAIVVLNYLVVMRINWQFVQPQGRYMFPALPAIVVALALGLEQWPLWRRRPATAGIFTIGACAAANVAILLLLVMPSYYPPLVEKISRVETPVAFSNTELIEQVRVPASDARFVIFDVQARAPRPDVTGAVILGLEHLEAAGGSRKVIERRFPFRWLADGSRRTIYVTSLGERDWQGTVVSVRVAPVEDATNGQEMPVSVSNVRLTGSIPLPY